MKKRIYKNFAVFALMLVAIISLTSSSVSANCHNSCGMFDVSDVDIDIKYYKTNIKIDYTVKKYNRVDARYYNGFTGEKLKGAGAQNKLEDLFEGFDFSTKNQYEIENEILDRLNIPGNYKKFVYRVKLKNGQKIQYKIR